MRLTLLFCGVTSIMAGCGDTPDFVEVKKGREGNGFNSVSTGRDEDASVVVGKEKVMTITGGVAQVEITVEGHDLIAGILHGDHSILALSQDYNTLLNISILTRNFTATALPGLSQYAYLHATPDDIWATPSYGPTAYIITTQTEVTLSSPTARYSGSSSHLDGIYLTPDGGGNVTKINATTLEVEFWGVSAGGEGDSTSWRGGVVDPTTETLYAAPWEGSDGILTCSLVEKNCEVVPLPVLTHAAWSGVDVLGRYLVFSPYNSEEILVFDPVVGVAQYLQYPSPVSSAYSAVKTTHAVAVIIPSNATNFLTVSLCPEYRHHESDGGIAVAMVVVSIVLGGLVVFGTLYYYTHLKQPGASESSAYIPYDHSEMNLVVD